MQPEAPVEPQVVTEEPIVQSEEMPVNTPSSDMPLTTTGGKDTDVVPNFKPLEETSAAEELNMAPIEITPETQPTAPAEQAPTSETKDLPPQSQLHDLNVAPVMLVQNEGEQSALLLPEPVKKNPENIITEKADKQAPSPNTITWAEQPAIANVNTPNMPDAAIESTPQINTIPDAYQIASEPLPALETTEAPPSSDTSLVWQEIGDYKTSPFADAFRAAGAPTKESNLANAQTSNAVAAQSNAVQKNKNVTIFPIN
jgi:hypothetical protein